MTIKEARTSSGLTQRQLSELLGIPLRTVEQWESGKRKPPSDVEKMIVEKLMNIKKEQEEQE